MIKRSLFTYNDSTCINFKYLIPHSTSDVSDLIGSGDLYFHREKGIKHPLFFFRKKSLIKVRDTSIDNDPKYFNGMISSMLYHRYENNELVDAPLPKGDTLLDCWFFSYNENNVAQKLFSHLKGNTDFIGFVSGRNIFPELFGTNDINGGGFKPYMSIVPLIGSLKHVIKKKPVKRTHAVHARQLSFLRPVG